jgi:hypothetical protein
MVPLAFDVIGISNTERMFPYAPDGKPLQIATTLQLLASRRAGAAKAGKLVLRKPES